MDSTAEPNPNVTPTDKSNMASGEPVHEGTDVVQLQASEEIEAKDAEEETPKPSAQTPRDSVVNVLILGPDNFLENPPDLSSFLSSFSCAPLRLSPTVAIDINNTNANTEGGEDLLKASESNRYTSVKENHMDQSHSLRDIRIAEGNRIVSEGRKWYLTQVFYKYESEASSCVLHFNSNMKPIHFFDEASQSHLFVLVGLAETMNIKPYLGANADDFITKSPKAEESAEIFSTFVIHPPFPVIVDTINGAVPFCSQELLFTNGLKDYVNLKLNSGRCTRRTVCKHFDPFQKIQCRYGSNCHFIHIDETCMDRILQPATLYPPLRLPKLEDDLQISTCENNRRHDTLVLRYLPDDTSPEEIEYMFQECDGFRSCYFQRNEFYSSAIIRFDTVDSATRALIQASESELNISFYGVVEDLKALLITDSRECHYTMNALTRLPGDKIKEKEDNAPEVETTAQPERGRFRGDREFRHRRQGDHESGELRRFDDAKRRRGEVQENYQRAGDNADSYGQQSNQFVFPGHQFPPLPPNWSYQLNTKGTQFYFYAVGREDETTWYHPVTKEMYFPN